MKQLVVFCLTLILTACGSASLDEHGSTTPDLKLEEFFSGELKAYGMVQDRSGNLLRRFEVDLLGSWEGNKGKLEEWFRFDDGEKSTRTWYLEKTEDNNYQGYADDVIGVAKGQTSGSALYWTYELEIEVDGSLYEVTLDDWMFLIDENRLFNVTEMTKFGFKVGTLTLYIERV
ncbi:DUF3833 domain-containing protein [Vibrio sp. HN007]|uniref:DUF3833 domain-containing protein n=1 Tax=Vibrio iocasae TaxID=3098914 RepID=UPI0035D506EA